MQILKTFLVIVLLGLLVPGGGAGIQAQEFVDVNVEKTQDVPHYGIELDHDIAYIVGDKMYFNIVSSIGVGDYKALLKIFKLIEYFELDELVITIHSGGGDMFLGLSIAQLLREKIINEGLVVTVQVYGIAASAAVTILVSATKGRRYVTENSFIMIHELSEFIYMETAKTKDKMKQAKIMLMLQENGTDFLSKMTGKSKEEISKLRKEETWWTAEQAVENGFADKVIPIQ